MKFFHIDPNLLLHQRLMNWREENGIRVADIFYGGHVIGEAC
jgi:hypothetical protein